MSKKIISIMPVWDEQNIIGLSIASTKDIVYQYVILLQKGVDKSREVIEYCRNLWNLNIIIIDTEIKLREKRKMAIDITKEYADYYLIQDADEIYYTNTNKTNDTNKILDLIENGFTFCYTSILFLEKTFIHTSKDETLTWLIPHPFLFKNLPDIYFPNVGDMPLYDPNKTYHKIFDTGEKNNPFKMDCKIKNFRRIFLREVFTQWHDSDFEGSIEEYADKNHHTILWYRENVNKNMSLDEIINTYRLHLESNDEENFKWQRKYMEDEYYEYPEIIKKCIELNLLKGIDNINDLKYLKKI
jgi:hypothetical protein